MEIVMHTEGPWSDPTGIYDRNGERVIQIVDGEEGTESRRQIALVMVGPWGNRDNDEEAFSNARLISAAPDLVEALRTIAETEGRYLGGDATRKIAKAAIAKAEGRGGNEMDDKTEWCILCGKKLGNPVARKNLADDCNKLHPSQAQQPVTK